MAEETVMDSINLVNTEAVPRALTAAGRFEDSLSDITTTMGSFKRNADSQLEHYRRDINEQLTTAELRLEDTERKLQVLMNRLTSDVEMRTGEVEDSLSRRKELSEDFISESTSIDKGLDTFTNNLESFSSSVEGLSGGIAAGVSSYQEITDGLHEQLGDSFENYREAHAEWGKEIAGKLSEGTSTVLDKMGNLKDNIEGKIDEYEEQYTEVINILSEQTGSESQGFGEALEFAEQTVGGLNEIFDGSIGDIAEKLDEISGLIESIKPILEFIDDLT